MDQVDTQRHTCARHNRHCQTCMSKILWKDNHYTVPKPYLYAWYGVIVASCTKLWLWVSMIQNKIYKQGYGRKICVFLEYQIIFINIKLLRIPDSYGAKTTENQTPLSHFACLFSN